MYTQKITPKQLFLFHDGTESNINLVNAGLVSIDIYTSIYSPFMRMVIQMDDVFDFFKNVKFIGDEQFSLSLDDNYNKKEYTFYVNVNSPKIEGQRNTFDQKATIIFECVSRDCYDAHRAISRTFVGSGSDIVKQILEKNFLVEPDEASVETTTSLNFTSTNQYQSNYKTGLSIIDYVARNDCALFYQDIDEKYYYKKIETLLSGTPKPNIIKFTSNQVEYISPNHPDKYEFSNFFNNELLYKHGVLNTRLENLDPTSYKMNKQTLKIGDVVTTTQFGKGNFFDYIDENLSRVNYTCGHIENKLKRDMLIKQFESYEMIIQTESDMSRRVGDVVQLYYTGFDNSEKLHPLYNGNWLITSIRINIGKNESKQIIHLSKVKFDKDR